MPFARWQRTIVDGAGNIIPNPFIEVRAETPGAPLAVLYSDRNGAFTIGNEYQVMTGDGLAGFHVAGGAYRIRARDPVTGFEITWRYVGIGTAGESDSSAAFVPKGAWSSVTTYDLGDMVSHSVGGEPYSFVSNEDDNLNNEPPFDGAVGDSDAHWTVLGLVEVAGAPGSSDVVGTSVSSIAIGTGTKTFTVVESDRGWGVGARLRVSSDADPQAFWMEGVVTDYAVDALEILVDLSSGAGLRDDWTINIAGERGEQGLAGGDIAVREVTVAGAVAVLNGDEIILLNKAVAAATNVNFPPVASYTGRGISLKDIKGDAGANNITPVFDGAETCDGLAGTEFVINVNYGEQGVFRPLPSGAGWYIHRR